MTPTTPIATIASRSKTRLVASSLDESAGMGVAKATCVESISSHGFGRDLSMAGGCCRQANGDMRTPVASAFGRRQAARVSIPPGGAAVLPAPAPAGSAEGAGPVRSRTEAGNYFIAPAYIFATYSQFTR